jgi:hypothetical protein
VAGGVTAKSEEFGKFTMCMFKSETGVRLSLTPRIGDAVALKELSYVGKGSVPIVDLHDVYNFRQYVPNTPDSNYVWAIFGVLKINSAGNYNMCISSDDGYTGFVGTIQFRLGYFTFS